MKEKIKDIVSKQKKLTNCKNMIFEKENDILSCVKSINEEGVRMRQKKAAISLLELKNDKKNLVNEISELCKSFDAPSFQKKKMSSSAIAKCISEGVCKEELNTLKEAFKSI